MYNEENYEPDNHWAEAVIDDAKEIAACLGINIEEVLYSGFCSQGDGACFTGSLGYNADCLENIMAYAPLDKGLHEIAASWQQLRCPSLEVSVAHNDRYCHSNSVDYDFSEVNLEEVDPSRVKIVAASFMGWIYKQLEDAYNYACAWEKARAYVEADDRRIEAATSVRRVIAALRNLPEAHPTVINALWYQLRGELKKWTQAKEERRRLSSSFYFQDKTIKQFAKENI